MCQILKILITKVKYLLLKYMNMYARRVEIEV